MRKEKKKKKNCKIVATKFCQKCPSEDQALCSDKFAVLFLCIETDLTIYFSVQATEHAPTHIRRQ